MKAYRFLAFMIAVLVVVQAGAIAWAFFGMTDWITDEGGVVNKELLECDDCDQNFTAEWGFAIHMFFNGLLLIPLIALLLLVVSFFAKVPGGVLWALGIVLLVVLQVILLPMLSREIDPAFGGLHGINAIVILALAVVAGRSARSVMAASADVADVARV